MKITARIIGVSIYFLTLVIMCFLLIKSRKENVKKILFIYSILLSLMGFFFVPNIHNDLYRVYETMNEYSIIPFKSFFQNYVLKSSVTISLIYYWGIGQLKINGLLPFITSFIFYTNVFYIVEDYYKKNNITLSENIGIIDYALILELIDIYPEIDFNIKNSLENEIEKIYKYERK